MSSITKDFGISSSCLASYLKLAPRAGPGLSRVLSIDEFKGNAGGDKYQCILVNPVHYPVLDRSHLFYGFLKELFSQTTLIADKFHFFKQVVVGC